MADEKESLIITGIGDVATGSRSDLAIGSGGNYALSAARALVENTDLSAREIVEKSLKLLAIFMCLPIQISLSKNYRINKEKIMSEMTPREIVSELDQHYRPKEAKERLQSPLRNRWRSMQLQDTAS